MVARSGSSRRFLAVLLAVSMWTVTGTGGPAHAQGLFDVLRGIFGGSRPVQRVQPPVLLDGFPEDGIAEAPGEGGPYVAYCVRLCDGRYFPLPRNAGAPSMMPDKICSAMCPAAQTKVFSGTSISHALATDGRNYSSIKNAFLYREKMVEGCSCTNTATGTASLDPESDPTLRKGDIVVTRDGPKVFTGDGRLPHKPNEFVPAAAYKGLPMAVRQQLSAMRIAEEPAPQPVGPQEPRPSAVPPSPAPSQPLGPHASLSYMPVARGPVAEAFSTFR